MTRAKYRPYFSLQELELLSSLLQKHRPIEKGIIRYLSKYISDIKDGLREPNHVNQPTLVESLGMGFDESTQIASKALVGKECFDLWNNNIPLSPAQITLVLEYRYENNLMSLEEEEAYERNLMNSSKSVQG